MSNDGNKGNSDGQSTYDRKQQAGVKKGSTFQTYKGGKAVGVDYDLKNKIENQKLDKFHEAGKYKKTGHPVYDTVGSLFDKGSVKTREYFTDKVLGSTKAKNNIGYTQAEFKNLSSAKQNEVYGNYLGNRMSGKTDAYGNPTGGWRKENVGGKEVWMGGNENDNKVEKSTFQLEQENAAADAKKDQANEEQADYSKKKRLSVKSSRSLFANEGGRGFFN